MARPIIRRTAIVVNPRNVTQEFARYFDGAKPELLVRAPGRVNLIGEHTDYNEGFVLPTAPPRAWWGAAAPPPGRVVGAHSVALGGTCQVDLDNPGPPGGSQQWVDYIRGVAACLISSGCRLAGASLLVDGDVPVGGGLSSSASLEVGVAKALLGISGDIVETVELALICRQAENRYAGVPCGIMDQFACLLCRKGEALLLDCRTQQYEHVPVRLPGACFVIIDTQVRHALGRSEYPLRQQQCRQGIEYFRRVDPNVQALRDVNVEMLSRHLSQLDPVVAARCHHVVTENERVLAAATAFKKGDLGRVGKLLLASHESLRDRYEVSCPELDTAVEVAAGVEGVYGARMTGGGFGGCAVALVRDDAVEPLTAAIENRYNQVYSQPARILTTQPAAGAGLEML